MGECFRELAELKWSPLCVLVNQEANQFPQRGFVDIDIEFFHVITSLSTGAPGTPLRHTRFQTICPVCLVHTVEFSNDMRRPRERVNLGVTSPVMWHSSAVTGNAEFTQKTI